MSKSRGPRSKKHIDEEKLRESRRATEDLRSLLDCGDEEGFITLVKELRPGIKPEELVHLVRRFREERAKSLRAGEHLP